MTKCYKSITADVFNMLGHNKVNINENEFVVEGSLRLQSNVLAAKNKFGHKFNGEIILMSQSDYFGTDYSGGNGSFMIPILVCEGDNSIILGKLGFDPKVDFKYCDVELVERFLGRYYPNITKFDETVIVSKKKCKKTCQKEITKE